MKKLLISAFLLAVICACLFSCGEKEDTGSGLHIVATVFPQYDFASRIAEGTDARVTMLMTPGSEAHSYEPTPADMVEITGCDLFITVGGESEAWAKKIADSAGLDGEKMLSLMEVAFLLPEEEGIEHEHGDEDEHEDEYDEHVWTSPKNAIAIVSAISQKMCALDGKNADKYRENTEKYVSELEALDEKFASLSEGAKGKMLIFGDRFPFLYLAREYGFEYRSAFSGCSAQTEASAATIAALIDVSREEDAKVIFAVDFSNGKLAKMIADEVGAKVEFLYSAHTVAASDMEKGVGYLDIMEQNLEKISEALGK